MNEEVDRMQAINDKYSQIAPANQSNIAIDMKRQGENNASVAEIQNASKAEGQNLGQEEGFNAGVQVAEQQAKAEFDNQDLGYGVTRGYLNSIGVANEQIQSISDRDLHGIGQQKLIQENNQERNRNQMIVSLNDGTLNRNPAEEAIWRENSQIQSQDQVNALAQELRMTPDEVIELMSQR